MSATVPVYVTVAILKYDVRIVDAVSLEEAEEIANKTMDDIEYVAGTSYTYPDEHAD